MANLNLSCVALLAAAAACAGCARYDEAQALRNATTTLAVPAESIEFREQCDFAVTAVNATTATHQTAGVLVLTGQELAIFSRDETDQYVPRVRFPYTQLKGVALWRFGRGRQLQVFTESSLIIVAVTAGKILADPTAAEEAFSLLIKHGVPRSEDVGLVTTPPPMLIFVP